MAYSNSKKKLFSSEKPAIDPKKKATAGSPEMVKSFNETSDYNTKARANEMKAKSDSTSVARKHLFDNKKSADPLKTKAMAERAGNTAANATRKADGGAKVTRYAEIPSGGKMDNSSGKQDNYIRAKKVEKDFDRVKNAKKFIK